MMTLAAVLLAASAVTPTGDPPPPDSDVVRLTLPETVERARAASAHLLELSALRRRRTPG